MPYVDLAGLSRFAGKSKDFASSACAGLDMANWQRTAAAGAVSFLPVPEMPLEPVVNFMFTETGPASGTKSPDNPSTITGVSQVKVTRCGKNLIPIIPQRTPWTNGGVTFAPNEDGSYHVYGTATQNVFYGVTTTSDHLMVPGLEYTLSGTPSGGGSSSYGMRIGDYTGTTDYGSGNTFTAGEGYENSRVLIRVASGTTVDVVFRPQLELGSAATSFEPYEGADYTLPLGGTYYGGSVDLNTGVMTVTWYGEQISDAYTIYETYYTNTLVVGLYATKGHEGNIPNISNYLVTDKFPSINGSEDVEHCRFSGGAGTARHVFNIYVNKSRLDVSAAVDPSSPTDAEWFAAARAWMQNNPVFACYRLFTPEIVQLTPTQIYSLSQLDLYTSRLNTVYSDQTSVQVGYPKSPQASQTELTNAIVSLGGNL